MAVLKIIDVSRAPDAALYMLVRGWNTPASMMRGDPHIYERVHLVRGLQSGRLVPTDIRGTLQALARGAARRNWGTLDENSGRARRRRRPGGTLPPGAMAAVGEVLAFTPPESAPGPPFGVGPPGGEG